MDDVPLRIGDADRDRAVELLRTAMAEGRLTYDEFDERLGIALNAKFESDLEPLFADLPTEPPTPTTTPANRSLQLGPTGPDHQVDVHPYAARRRHLYGALWPMTLMLMFASGFRLWWLIFVPLVLGPILAGSQRARGERRQLPPRRH